MKSEKKGDYKWQSRWALIFAGGARPRIVIYPSFKAFQKTEKARGTGSSAGDERQVGLRGVAIVEEPEDKFRTVLLRIDQPGGGSGGGADALRLRVEDKNGAASPVKEALGSAAGS